MSPLDDAHALHLPHPLLCPACGEALRFALRGEPGDLLGPWGTARCACPAHVPVALGIVFVSVTRPSQRGRALEAIAAGRPAAALAALTGLSAGSVERLVQDPRRSFDAFVDALPTHDFLHYLRRRPVATSFRANHAFLNALAARPGPYVDVGGAIGLSAFILSTLRPDQHVTLLDHSPLLCLCARLFCVPARVSVVCCEINGGWPFPAGALGGVNVCDTFQCVANKELFCRRIARSLAPGGLALYSHAYNVLQAEQIRSRDPSGLGMAARPDDYLAALGPGALAFADADLLEAWRGARPLQPTAAADLDAMPSLAFAVGAGAPATIDTAAVPGWTRGPLALNPAFQVVDRAGPTRLVRRQLPAEFWREFPEALDAFPSEAELDERRLASEAERLDLVRRGWLLPLPPTYLPDAAPVLWGG